MLTRTADIIWRRTWPIEPEAFTQPHVSDDPLELVREPMSGKDYAPVFAKWANLDADGIVCVEWDILIEGYTPEEFQRRIERSPQWVHVIPYRYGETMLGQDGPAFGLGCTYLPLKAIREYVNAEHHPHAQWGSDVICYWIREQGYTVDTHHDLYVKHLKEGV